MRAGGALAACGDRQSVLNPKGPQAFGIGPLELVFVRCRHRHPSLGHRCDSACDPWTRSATCALGIRPNGGLGRRRVPSRNPYFLLSYGVWLTRATAVALDDPNAVRVTVIGEQWWWRLLYEHNGTVVAAANEIRIPVGRAVVFKLSSPDVIHSFWVPNLGGKVDMIPGRTTHLRLRADQPGVFRGQCAEYCGGPHALMAFEVVALSEPDFESWLEAQSKPSAAPASEAQRGRELFLAAGCGACHAIRGTPAAGTIGPDLTHLATRRSVGLDTMPMTEANIQRFIRDGQHIKPGNLMPPFRIFAQADLEALAAYLAGLR